MRMTLLNLFTFQVNDAHLLSSIEEAENSPIFIIEIHQFLLLIYVLFLFIFNIDKHIIVYVLFTAYKPTYSPTLLTKSPTNTPSISPTLSTVNPTFNPSKAPTQRPTYPIPIDDISYRCINDEDIITCNVDTFIDLNGDVTSLRPPKVAFVFEGGGLYNQPTSVSFSDITPAYDPRKFQTWFGAKTNTKWTNNNATIAWIQQTIHTQINKEWSGPRMHEYYLKWDKFVSDFNAKSPAQFKCIQTSSVYIRMEVEVTFIDGFIKSVAYTMILCSIVMIFFTQNLCLVLLVCLYILVICIWVIGIFGLCKWPFGIIEIISVPTIVGLAIDFALHITHAYIHSPFPDIFIFNIDKHIIVYNEAFQIDPLSAALIWRKLFYLQFYFTPLGTHCVEVFLYFCYLGLFTYQFKQFCTQNPQNTNVSHDDYKENEIYFMDAQCTKGTPAKSWSKSLRIHLHLCVTTPMHHLLHLLPYYYDVKY